MPDFNHALAEWQITRHRVLALERLLADSRQARLPCPELEQQLALVKRDSDSLLRSALSLLYTPQPRGDAAIGASNAA